MIFGLDAHKYFYLPVRDEWMLARELSIPHQGYFVLLGSNGRSLEIAVQPLQAVLRPKCFAQMQIFAQQIDTDDFSHGGRLGAGLDTKPGGKPSLAAQHPLHFDIQVRCMTHL